MFSPVEVPLWWGRNGVYVALFVGLTTYFAGANQILNACLLPACAVCSGSTIQRLAGSRSPLAYWWSASVVRWLSWAILNLGVSLFFCGFIGFSVLIFAPAPDYRYIPMTAFVITLLILARHVFADSRDVRRDYGSIRNAAQVLCGADWRVQKAGTP